MFTKKRINYLMWFIMLSVWKMDRKKFDIKTVLNKSDKINKNLTKTKHLTVWSTDGLANRQTNTRTCRHTRVCALNSLTDMVGCANYQSELMWVLKVHSFHCHTLHISKIEVCSYFIIIIFFYPWSITKEIK